LKISTTSHQWQHQTRIVWWHSWEKRNFGIRNSELQIRVSRLGRLRSYYRPSEGHIVWPKTPTRHLGVRTTGTRYRISQFASGGLVWQHCCHRRRTARLISVREVAKAGTESKNGFTVLKGYLPTDYVNGISCSQIPIALGTSSVFCQQFHWGRRCRTIDRVQTSWIAMLYLVVLTGYVVVEGRTMDGLG
jgi:hypothetical protein